MDRDVKILDISAAPVPGQIVRLANGFSIDCDSFPRRANVKQKIPQKI